MMGSEGKLYIIRKQENYPDIQMPAEMYFADFKKRIQQMIGLVENICYTNEGGKDKECWNSYNASQFQNFRRRMLDIADEVAKLEENMVLEADNIVKDLAAKESIVKAIFARKGK